MRECQQTLFCKETKKKKENLKIAANFAQKTKGGNTCLTVLHFISEVYHLILGRKVFQNKNINSNS